MRQTNLHMLAAATNAARQSYLQTLNLLIGALPPHQRRVMEYALNDEPHLSTAILVERFGLRPSAASTVLKSLHGLGLLDRIERTNNVDGTRYFQYTVAHQLST